jgi:hypothetical protein
MAEVVIVRSAMRDLDRLDATLEEIDLVTSHLQAVLQARVPYGQLLFANRNDILFTDVGRFRILFMKPNDVKVLEIQLRR